MKNEDKKFQKRNQGKPTSHLKEPGSQLTPFFLKGQNYKERKKRARQSKLFHNKNDILFHFPFPLTFMENPFIFFAKHP